VKSNSHSSKPGQPPADEAPLTQSDAWQTQATAPPRGCNLHGMLLHRAGFSSINRPQPCHNLSTSNMQHTPEKLQKYYATGHLSQGWTQPRTAAHGCLPHGQSLVAPVKHHNSVLQIAYRVDRCSSHHHGLYRFVVINMYSWYQDLPLLGHKPSKGGDCASTKYCLKSCAATHM
jgi:hypothetical protein